MLCFSLPQRPAKFDGPSLIDYYGSVKTERVSFEKHKNWNAAGMTYIDSDLITLASISALQTAIDIGLDERAPECTDKSKMKAQICVLENLTVLNCHKVKNLTTGEIRDITCYVSVSFIFTYETAEGTKKSRFNCPTFDLKTKKFLTPAQQDELDAFIVNAITCYNDYELIINTNSDAIGPTTTATASATTSAANSPATTTSSLELKQ